MAVIRYPRLAAELRRRVADGEHSQAQLARELNTSDGRVSHWLSGEDMPNRASQAKLKDLLGDDLQAFFDNPIDTYDVFVSTPIASLADADVGKHHDMCEVVVNSLKDVVETVFWPGERIREPGRLLPANLVYSENLVALYNSRALIYLQFLPTARPSSTLIELGFAVGRLIKTTIILGKDVAERPYIFNNFESVAGDLAALKITTKTQVYTGEDPDHIAGQIRNSGPAFLGL